MLLIRVFLYVIINCDFAVIGLIR